MKMRTTITFEIDDVCSMAQVDKRELRDFIKGALESWGGQRHPDDWLFGSLEKVEMTAIQQAFEEEVR